MSTLTRKIIDSSSNDELFAILSKELEMRVPVARSSPSFVSEIRKLPVGLRAMAATYELDVSLTMDDLGWHFGNWHDQDLGEETIRGLEELGAVDLARVFQQAFERALEYWDELGSESWPDWYHGSSLEKAVGPLNEQAWSILEGKKNGIFEYWVDYARRCPGSIGVATT